MYISNHMYVYDQPSSLLYSRNSFPSELTIRPQTPNYVHVCTQAYYNNGGITLSVVVYIDGLPCEKTTLYPNFKGLVHDLQVGYPAHPSGKFPGKYQNFPEEQSSTVRRQCGQLNGPTKMRLRD